MAVTVVFADGSKKMAHNLDDTRERWELRRDPTDRDIQSAYVNGYAIPMVDALTDVESVLKHRPIIMQMLASIKQRKAIVFSSRMGAGYMRQLNEVSSVLGAQLAMVDQIYKLRKQELVATKDEEIGRYAHELERRCLAFGVPLPPPPVDDWLTVDELDEMDRMVRDGIYPNRKQAKKKIVEQRNIAQANGGPDLPKGKHK